MMAMAAANRARLNIALCDISSPLYHERKGRLARALERVTKPPKPTGAETCRMPRRREDGTGRSVLANPDRARGTGGASSAGADAAAITGRNNRDRAQTHGSEAPASFFNASIAVFHRAASVTSGAGSTSRSL
jgi:hypothetical protein